ncbi:uncharacterized protein LOC114288024 [Camellia sinensis]|uniref:uncharacterized protein LOC114288024 n=1 Tax=Camellia sinensis TaxID=4442 RepID=UPI001035FB27|nr:uncharacterized protein LOC114288024 [Camellia sinensis]
MAISMMGANEMVEDANAVILTFGSLSQILFRGYTDQMVEDANAVISTFGSYRLGVNIFMLAAAKLKGPFLCGCNQVVEIEVFIVFLLPCNNGSLLYGVDVTLIATGRGPFTKGLGLENINVVTQWGFVLVDERMQVIDANGNLVPHLYCIDDANEKMILAYAASAQGISVVEQVNGKDHVLNHLSIPAACFTHLEISNGWTHRALSEGES